MERLVSRVVRASSLALCLSAIAGSVFAQAPSAQGQFAPTIRLLVQAGKDVVWVPTPQTLVDKMLDMANVTPEDYLIDLGSGDGRMVIAAAKRGARAVGIEYNPKMVELSTRNAAAAGVTGKATFVKADLFESDLSQATVVTMFLGPEINLRLRPTLLKLTAGTRLVSNTFTMGEWTADETQRVTQDCEYWCTALLWIVPARAEGAWRLPEGELTLKQDFQRLSGSLKTDNGTAPIADGRLRGNQISFGIGGARYTGRVGANTIVGTVASGGNKSTWSATRAGQ
jgi:16S rRNA G966 N2-methylase RsmD